VSTATKARIDTAYQRLREHLAYLGLATASEELAPALERARTLKLSAVEVLEDLLAKEAEATRARRLAGRLRFAHYPLRKTLADFEFDYQPSIDQKLLGELSALRFVEERRNVLLLGPPGVGKTHLAIALGIAATEAGYRTYFTTASDLVTALQAAHLEGMPAPRCGPSPAHQCWWSTSSATYRWIRPRPTGSSRSSPDATSAARSC